MSKIFIAVFFAISIQFVFADSSTIEMSEKIYTLIKDLFIGLVTGDEDKSKCIKVLNDKKQYIVENIDDIISDINNDELFDKILLNSLNIITIHGLAKNCKLMNFIFFYNQLTQLDEIKKLGQTIHKEAEKIADIFDPETTSSFFKKLGVFSRKILGFTVK